MVATVETAGTNVAILVPRYYEKRLIEGLYPKTYLYKYADKYSVPLNAGATVYFQKYTEDTKAAGRLTEGTVVTATELSGEGRNVTLLQRGVAKFVSDVMDMTAINPVVTSAVDNVLTPKAAITVDKEILWRLTGSSDVLSLEGVDPNGALATTASPSEANLSQFLDGQNGGLSTLYLSCDGRKYATSNITAYSLLSAAGGTAVGNWLTTCKLGSTIVKAAVKELDSNNAIPGDGGLYDGFAHPRALFDLKNDPDFVAWNTFGNPSKGETGIIGTFGGVRWWSTTQMPIIGNRAGFTGYSFLASNTGHMAYFSFALTLIMGKGAVGVTELAGQGGVKMYVKKPGDTTTSDPLNQYSTIGFKITMGAVALNKKCGYFLLTPIEN